MSRPPATRLAALFVTLTLALAGIAVRVAILQVGEAAAYEALAEQQRVRRVELRATRGAIYDRSGRELALSIPARAVYAHPALVERPVRTSKLLAPILGSGRRRLRRLLTAEAPFVYLDRGVEVGRARRVERLRLPGIGLLEESRRTYPARHLAAHTIGFVGVDGSGLAGIELGWDELLAGRAGELVVEQDPSGRLIPESERRIVEPVPGRDLVLTIDRDIQFEVERTLAAAVAANGAKGGMVVVLDPSTGDVLAMATAPSFDANRFAKTSPGVARNRVVTDVYEPGSVNKVITAAAVIEEQTVGLQEVFEVPDRIRVGDHVFTDAHPHPPMRMTITDIIAQSSNVGTIGLADRLGQDRLAEYLERFGFGRETGVGFPGEVDGLLLPRDNWWITSMGTIPIGQGIAVTPIQMAAVYATVANGGEWVRPRLVQGISGPDGSLIEADPSPRRRVVSRDTADIVARMLARAVASGTGERAAVPGYWVAGKTGTARKPLADRLGYSERFMASFIGFAPAIRPRVVVAAILDEPSTVYGGVAAAPLFREVTRFALGHLHVPSTREPDPLPTAEQ